MWIFDSGYNGHDGSVELWSKRGVNDRTTTRSTILYPQSFYLHLDDPHAHWEMIEALETIYKVEECSFQTVQGPLDGYRIYAGRKAAEQIEIQTKMAAKLYNVDLRSDQKFLSEKGLSICGEPNENRFSPTFKTPLNISTIDFMDEPSPDRKISVAKIVADMGYPGSESDANDVDYAEFEVDKAEGPGGVGGVDRAVRMGKVSGLGGAAGLVNAGYVGKTGKNCKAGEGYGESFAETLKGSERQVLADLFERLHEINPDVMLMPHADVWMSLLQEKAKRYDLDLTFSRNGRFDKLESRSYWSYGRVKLREAALIPKGRILIDTKKSFTYREAGLKGILLASRLTGISPNLTSRFTPGTLVSSYEVYEAVRRGIAVPFRKMDPERFRNISDLRASDKGGLMFQPSPGVYEAVHQIDFTSLYPSIIVNYNLSPETLGQPIYNHRNLDQDGVLDDYRVLNDRRSSKLLNSRPVDMPFNKFYDRNLCACSSNIHASTLPACNAADMPRGFLSAVLEPLLKLRIKTKDMKKAYPRYKGCDALLKWMLVTSFGYTGYRNAKFGQIEVHERITSISRELLCLVKEIAEEMGFCVLHGIVDCLWVQGKDVAAFKKRVERETGILTEVESYDWIAFLEMADKRGAYNRYLGRLTDGKMKVRGIMARRGDTPLYVKRMQQEVIDMMAGAKDVEGLRSIEPDARKIYMRYIRGLSEADVCEMVINKRISRLDYLHRCAEGSAVKAYMSLGVPVAPGMELGYVVRDSSRWIVDPKSRALDFDVRYYRSLLEKAWEELVFVFRYVSRDKRSSDDSNVG